MRMSLTKIEKTKPPSKPLLYEELERGEVFVFLRATDAVGLVTDGDWFVYLRSAFLIHADADIKARPVKRVQMDATWSIVEDTGIVEDN